MTNEIPQQPQEKPIMEQAKELLENLNKAKAEAKAEADRLEKLKSENLLSGTGGARPQIEVKPETPGEYAKRMLRGGK